MTNIVTSKTREVKTGRADSQGKGSWRRRQAVGAKEFARRWCRTFGHRPAVGGRCPACGAKARA